MCRTIERGVCKTQFEQKWQQSTINVVHTLYMYMTFNIFLAKYINYTIALFAGSPHKETSGPLGMYSKNNKLEKKPG